MGELPNQRKETLDGKSTHTLRLTKRSIYIIGDKRGFSYTSEFLSCF